MAKNIFNSIKLTRPKKNSFNLTHDKKLSLNMGLLYPTMVREVIPGDIFKLGGEAMIRFAPMTFPVFHRLHVRQEYFFVPNRLLWDKFEKWISVTPDPVTLPAFPTITVDETNSPLRSLADHLGIPIPLPGQTEVVNAMPFAAYQFIVNEYYRDQNQMAEIAYKLVNGSNDANADLMVLRNRCWEHDYFTSALPSPQKGDGVQIPIDGFNDVPVIVNPLSPPAPGGFIQAIEQPGNIAVGYTVDQEETHAEGKLMAKTSDIDQMSTTITDLRRAEAVQKFLERLNIGGSRFKEFIKSMFGEDTGDARLDRPEYITGMKSPVIISEVLNTTGTTERPQGDQAGHGIAIATGYNSGYKVKEHGFIICMLSVMPMTAYSQGLEKHWLKHRDPYQYFNQLFEHIGEQEVENREIFAFKGDITGSATWGYNPRFSEYKYANNMVAGEFRSNLQFMHWGRIFGDLPPLNEDFMKADPRTDPFAVEDPTIDHLYAHVLHKITAIRGMSKYSTPSM